MEKRNDNLRSRQSEIKALFEKEVSTFKLRLAAIQSQRREGETDAGERPLSLGSGEWNPRHA